MSMFTSKDVPMALWSCTVAWFRAIDHYALSIFDIMDMLKCTGCCGAVAVGCESITHYGREMAIHTCMSATRTHIQLALYEVP
jgi:hypothetical protein